jgi:Fe-S oxidoreductase
MDIALALVDNRLDPDKSPKLLDVFYKCNTCGGCDVACKRNNDMEPLRVMLDIRAKLVEMGQLLPQHGPVVESLKREDNTMLGLKADRGRWADGLKIKDITQEPASILFHCGCHISYDEKQWPIARQAVTLLEKAGLNVGIMGKDESCCGGKMFDMGYRGEFIKYAENNFDAWKNASVKTVVTTCADCYYTFKHLYPEIGGKFEVYHIVEYLDKLVKNGQLKLREPVRMNVTYHDPCHLGRRDNDRQYLPGKTIMGLYEQPRDVIRAIPGIEFVEMFRVKEYAWCCGSGGGVKEGYPDFSQWTARERIKEAQEVGAEAIVTTCPWCERAFLNALDGMNISMKVFDIIELVQMAL